MRIQILGNEKILNQEPEGRSLHDHTITGMILFWKVPYLRDTIYEEKWSGFFVTRTGEERTEDELCNLDVGFTHWSLDSYWEECKEPQIGGKWLEWGGNRGGSVKIFFYEQSLLDFVWHCKDCVWCCAYLVSRKTHPELRGARELWYNTLLAAERETYSIIKYSLNEKSQCCRLI